MGLFKKNNFTKPVICKHNNDIAKDWYVFFQFKFEGKFIKYKRREGINRIKDLEIKKLACEELQYSLYFDLKHGWNPKLDPSRELDYNPYKKSLIGKTIKEKLNKIDTKQELINKYLNKGNY